MGYNTAFKDKVFGGSEVDADETDPYVMDDGAAEFETDERNEKAEDGTCGVFSGQRGSGVLFVLPILRRPIGDVATMKRRCWMRRTRK